MPEAILPSALGGFSALAFPALANEHLATRLFSSTDALARVSEPPVGYAQDGSNEWVITVAMPAECSVHKYRTGLEEYIPEDVDRQRIYDTSFDDLPF